MTDGKAAIALGAAGIGIGIAEITAPYWLNKQLGVRVRPGLMRAMGAREIASSIAILARKDRSIGQWARVAGDVVDVALLGLALRRSRRRKVVLGVLGAVLAIGVLDLLVARRL